MNIRNILLVAATSLELEPLLSAWSVGPIQTGRVTTIMLKQTPVDILITGPGMVATAFFLGRLRGLHEYVVVVNAGIAGSYNKALSLGTVVNVTTDCFPEMGAWNHETFNPLYGMPMAAEYRTPYFDTENVIRNCNPPVLASIAELPQVKGITVNTITGKPWSAAATKQAYQPDIETMEGAAFLYACQAKAVPCIQIRAISNRIGVEPPEPWDIPIAVNALHTTLVKLFDEL